MSELPENFADYPTTVGERRSDADGNAALWSPRDALIHLLRAIDNGEDIDALVIFYRPRPEKSGVVTSLFISASPDPHVSLGMVEIGKHKMLADLRK